MGNTSGVVGPETTRPDVTSYGLLARWSRTPEIDNRVHLTNEWIIQRFVRIARVGEDEDLYESWPGYDSAMSQTDAERAINECAQRWPDFDFQAHRVRVHEKIADEAIARARRSAGEQ